MSKKKDEKFFDPSSVQLSSSIDWSKLHGAVVPMPASRFISAAKTSRTSVQFAWSTGSAMWYPEDVLRVNCNRMTKRIVLSFAGSPSPPEMILEFIRGEEYERIAAQLLAPQLSLTQGEKSAV